MTGALPRVLASDPTLEERCAPHETRVQDIPLSQDRWDGTDRDQERAIAILKRIEKDASIPDDCRLWLTGRQAAPYVKAIVRGQFPVPSAHGLFVYETPFSVELHKRFQDGYRLVISKHCQRPENAKNAEANQAYVDCLKQAGDGAWKSYGAQFGASVDELAQAWGIDHSSARVLKAFHSYLSASSFESFRGAVKAGRDGLSYREFIALMAMIERDAVKSYQTGRMDRSTSESLGSVSGESIRSAASSNNRYGVRYVDSDPGKALAMPEGVCRDVSGMVALLMQDKGFPHVYMVTYDMSEKSHSTVIAEMPGEKGTHVLLNWEDNSRRKWLDGGLALGQSKNSTSALLADRTLGFKISKPDPRTGAMGLIAVVPSEMGKFLSEVAGFDARYQDGLARTRSTLEAVQVGLGDRNRVEVRLFHGRDGGGTQYVGVASDFGWGQDTLAPGRAGVVVGRSEAEQGVYPGLANQHALGYLEVEQHLAPRFNLSKQIAMTLDTSANFRMLGEGVYAGENEGMKHVIIDHVIKNEARFDARDASDKFRASYYVGVLTRIGQNDLRNRNAYGLRFMQFQIGADARVRVGDLVAFGDTLVVIDQIGQRGRLEVGLAGASVSASAYVLGRVSDNTAILEDGSIRRAGVTIQGKPIDQIKTGLTGETLIEGDAESVKQNLRVIGTAEVMLF